MRVKQTSYLIPDETVWAAGGVTGITTTVAAKAEATVESRLYGGTW